ncbi:MAG TPA: site-specific DNA-methyltransferase [Elusimicrobiales bacterium]|nr:site-specific DNA-methyltransferase [Elusimicrobiales bacterium]
MFCENTILNNDCIKAMAGLPDNHFDAIVTDPPYELGFLGNAWDKTGVAFNPETWKHCLRLAKSGAHLLAFGGSRTFHRLAAAIEDAGWEIRDCILWLYGTGFPKSLNMRGNWQGFGTGLKPAFEPIILARKPMSGSTKENLRRHGCGALNIDGCRVPAEVATGWRGGASRGYGGGLHKSEDGGRPAFGRWPANVMHDGSREVVQAFPQEQNLSAARFFYCAKASRQDREEGLQKFVRHQMDILHSKASGPRRNIHPTVKPTSLMRYLCRLITPPGGLVLDPFTGSGSTGKAAVLEGFRFLGIEQMSKYAAIAKARIDFALRQLNGHGTFAGA